MKGKMFRINNLELSELDKKTREINRERAVKNLTTYKDTELLHEVLRTAIKSISLDKEGRPTISQSQTTQ